MVTIRRVGAVLMVAGVAAVKLLGMGDFSEQQAMIAVGIAGLGGFIVVMVEACAWIDEVINKSLESQ